VERIGVWEEQTYNVSHTRSSIETGGEGLFENIRVDGASGFRGFGQIFAHTDFVRCARGLRLDRDQKGGRKERTAESRFNSSTGKWA
jgi:hypothetical protein